MLKKIKEILKKIQKRIKDLENWKNTFLENNY